MAWFQVQGLGVITVKSKAQRRQRLLQLPGFCSRVLPEQLLHLGD